MEHGSQKRTFDQDPQLRDELRYELATWYEAFNAKKALGQKSGADGKSWRRGDFAENLRLERIETDAQIRLNDVLRSAYEDAVQEQAKGHGYAINRVESMLHAALDDVITDNPKLKFEMLASLYGELTRYFAIKAGAEHESRSEDSSAIGAHQAQTAADLDQTLGA